MDADYTIRNKSKSSNNCFIQLHDITW